MANTLKIKRGSKTQIDTAGTNNQLIQGEPYLITDEGRIAVGLTSATYAAFAKTTEVQPLDDDLTAIAALAGTSGFIKKTAANTYVLDTNTYLTAETDTLSAVTGRGASTATAITLTGGVTINASGSTNGAIFAGSTSGTTKVVASATAGTTTITLPATTGTVALQGDTHYIGTTAVTLSRASANLALTGISSIALPGATSGTITLQPTAVAGTTTLTLPATTGTIALTSDLPTVNNGTFTLNIGAAAATANAVTISAGTGYSANSATNTTYSVSVGPALTALATLMTTAGAGFIKRGATADTYTIDTSTYLTGNQSISLTGDISGSGTTSISTTLATVNSNVGTFTKVTVNAKGLVTAATSLIATDIPTLTAAKISDFDTQVRTSRLDQMSVPTASVAFNSQKITGLADPTLAQDAATKNYVDTVAQGLDAKLSVRVATTANITLSAPQTIDGIAVIAGDRVLVKNQTTTTENGIYVVAAGAWARATDADTFAELVSAFTFVEEGTANADTGWVSTVNAGGTLGSTAIAFTQFSAAGAYVAGTGMVLSGNTFNVQGTASRISVTADNVDIDSNYVGQTSITTLGTIATGTWNATAIAATVGGTGQTTYAAGDILYASATNTLSKLTKPASLDSFLQMTSAGVPSWVSTIDGGSF
jgi:hypothetical protein